MDAVLKVDKLSLSYGGRQVLRDVSFSLAQGRVHALLGPNGAGKTSLLNVLSGFLKWQDGAVYLDGVPLRSLAPHAIARLGVGRTFQDLRLARNLTAHENILLALPNHPTGTWLKAILRSNAGIEAEFHLRAASIARDFFLQDAISQAAGALSYGQQKLLTLAVAVASGARVLLLDEPVAGINPMFRSLIVEKLSRLAEDGKAILLIEHNTDLVQDVASDLFFLHQGQLKHYADYSALKMDESVQKAYL